MMQKEVILKAQLPVCIYCKKLIGQFVLFYASQIYLLDYD